MRTNGILIREAFPMRVLTSIAMAAACVLLSTAIAMAQTLTTLSGKPIRATPTPSIPTARRIARLQ